MSNTQRELPMFPIGSAVFPSQVVPLHIFEPRYLALMEDLMAPGSDATFAMVLIRRGHEVGGGDARCDVATRVEILQAEEFNDGRWGVVAAGVERLDVVEWLSNDPYPRAVVSPRSVVDNGGSSLVDLEALVRESLALAAAQRGVDMPEDLAFSADPHQLLDQLSALSPLTEFDRQRVLEASTTTEQITRLTTALDEKLLLLRSVGE